MSQARPAIADGLSQQGVADDCFEWLAESVPGTVYRCLLDDAWTILRITRSVETLTGYPADDFIQNRVRTFDSVIDPTDRQRVARTVAEAVEKDAPYYIEYRIVAKNGTTKWVHEKGRAVRDAEGDVAWLDGFIMDVTEFEALRRAEEKRRHALQTQQLALVSLATASSVAEGELKAVSKLATELAAEAVGVERVSVWLLHDDRTHLQSVDLYRRSLSVHESDLVLAAEDYPSYFAAMQSGRLVDAHDALGDPRTSELAEGYLKALGISSMLDATLRVGGEVVGVVRFEHVGPQRTWLDHEMHFAGEVSDQIAHALLNRARLEAHEEQESLRQQLFRSQKLEAVGRLAGGVAHDFNNLLTVITGHAELLLLNLPEGSDKEDAAQIAATAQRAGELTHQLLAFSREEKLALREVDLVAAVASVERMLRRLIDDDIELDVQLPSSPMAIRATDGLVQQVMTNLVINARDAMPSGGRITVSLETRVLSGPQNRGLSELSPGAYAIVHVSDTGVGMTPEVLDNIFEPFFTTKKELGKGTGLGLSMVYGIARQCGGAITVESTVGVGTRFLLYVPLVEHTAATPSPANKDQNLIEFGEGRLVVVAEDNQGVLNVVTRVLQRSGFRTLSALNATEAILQLSRMVEDKGPDRRWPCLVISDVVMPGGGGLDVLEWVQKCMPSVPVALMSGYMDERTQRNASDVPRIPKPFSTTELCQWVRDILEDQARKSC